MKQAYALVLLILLLILIHPAAFSQAGSGQSDTVAASAAPATTAYTLAPEQLRKAKALYYLDGTLEIGGFLYSNAVLLVLLFLGITVRYRSWAEKISRWSFVQACIVVPLFVLTISLLALPLDVYSHHVSLQYGFSVQGWASWFADFLKEQGVLIVLAVPLLWIMNFLIRKSPRRSWFYCWLGAIPLVFLATFLFPVVIEPMFHTFEPLEKNHAALTDAIEGVVQRAGLSIPKDRMYEMKASDKVTTLNAYVTGLGASKRVVVWDNTIQKLTTPETLFVFGHEMGHYVLRHIVFGLTMAILALLPSFYLVYRFATWMQARFGQRWELTGLGDWAALPMFFLIFGVLGFVTDPISNALSRHIEHQADVYGLEVTHGLNPNSQEAAAHAFQVLGEMSLDYPYPSKFAVIWFYNHPPIADRVRFAQTYDPWSKGVAPRYVK